MISDWQEARLFVFAGARQPRHKKNVAARGLAVFGLGVAPTTTPSSVKRVPRTTLFGCYPKATTNLCPTNFSLSLISAISVPRAKRQTRVCRATATPAGRCAVPPHHQSNSEKSPRQNRPHSSSPQAFPDRETETPNQEDTRKHCATR